MQMRGANVANGTVAELFTEICKQRSHALENKTGAAHLTGNCMAKNAVPISLLREAQRSRSFDVVASSGLWSSLTAHSLPMETANCLQVMKVHVGS